MALLIGDNFSYNGKKPNFERDSFETLAALKAFAEANIDNGHIAYCVETNKHYIFNDSNSDDTTTGKWRVLESEFSNKVDQSDLTAQLATKEDQFTVGTGLEMTPERVLNVTLDITVFKVVASLPEQPASGDEQKIHLVPAESTGIQNIYNEYIWVSNTWELLGEYQSEVDLIPYLTKTDAQATYQPIGNYATKEEVEEVSEGIPSLNGYATETWVENKNYLTKVPIASENILGGIKVGAGLSISGDGILSATGGGVADSVAWENVVGRPTNLSQFTNDSGFITNSALTDYALKSELPDLSDYALKTEIPDTSVFATKTEVSAKQDTLVSGTNIKTINGTSLLGEGNIVIKSGGGSSEITDVLDNKIYARTRDIETNLGTWVDLTDYLTWGEYD